MHLLKIEVLYAKRSSGGDDIFSTSQVIHAKDQANARMSFLRTIFLKNEESKTEISSLKAMVFHNIELSELTEVEFSFLRVTLAT